MRGKLIVFEGIDGSGKSTQFQLMCSRLQAEGRAFHQLVFPQYDKPSSALLRMYLNGEFGQDPAAVNPYAASTFYAVDRYASYVQQWEAVYRQGGLILADRYTTSNAIHQGAKLKPEERTAFFQWLEEFEYRRMELPEPDTVLYMDVSLQCALANMRSREEKTGTKADIHEQQEDYLTTCLETAREASAHYHWMTIDCMDGQQMQEVQKLHERIYAILFTEKEG